MNNNTEIQEHATYDLQHQMLDLVAVLRKPGSGDADTIFIHPSWEPVFGRAAEQLAGPLVQMDGNGFHFAFDGKRIKVRTDSELPLDLVRFGDFAARNFRGVHAENLHPFRDSYTA